MSQKCVQYRGHGCQEGKTIQTTSQVRRAEKIKDFSQVEQAFQRITMKHVVRGNSEKLVFKGPRSTSEVSFINRSVQCRGAIFCTLRPDRQPFRDSPCPKCDSPLNTNVKLSEACIEPVDICIKLTTVHSTYKPSEPHTKKDGPKLQK